MMLAAGAGLIATSARSLAPFRLVQPLTVADVVRALDQGPDCYVLAGGTDLVAHYNDGLAPRVLVDLSKIDALREIERDGSVLRIGAMVSHGAGARHAGVRAAVPSFAAAWARIANPRIRLRATLGGNLMARRTRYEASLLLTAIGARLRFAAPGGERVVSPGALWRDGEVPAAALLTHIEIDTLSLIGFHYERSLRPLMTQALSVWRQGDGIRLVLVLGSEFLAPTMIQKQMPRQSVAQLADDAREMADDMLCGLPDTFCDPVVTYAYARRAGAALLARQLRALAND